MTFLQEGNSRISLAHRSVPKPTASPISRVYFIFFVIQIVLSLFMYQHMIVKRRSRITSAQKRQHMLSNTSHPHFLDAVWPYTHIRASSRNIASRSYISTPTFSNIQYRLFSLFFEDYVNFHASNRYNASRVLIFQPHPTGLGDRFGMLVYVYWCAVMSRRLLLIDWQTPFRLSDYLISANSIANTDMFYHDSDILRYEQAANASSQYHNYSITIYDIDYNSTTQIEVQEKLDGNTPVVIMLSRQSMRSSTLKEFSKRNIPVGFTMKEVACFGHFLTGTATDFQRAFAHHVLKPSMQLRRTHEINCRKLNLRCATTQHRHLMKITGRGNRREERYIAVHARLGVGVGEMTQARFLNLSVDLNEPARCLVNRAVKLSLMGTNNGTEGKALPIFLATDTPSFRQTFRDMVAAISGDRIRVEFGDWGVLHSSRTIRGRESTASINEAAEKGFMGVWMDLMMLGHSEHMVALYSSFPRLAMAVGDIFSITELRRHVCEQDRLLNH